MNAKLVITINPGDTVSIAAPVSHVDPLDIAYMGMGIAKVMQARGGVDGTRFKSEMDVVSAVIRHAELMGRIFAEKEDENSCVWAYEIAEPFGEHYTRFLLEGNEDTDNAASTMIRNLFNDANTVGT